MNVHRGFTETNDFLLSVIGGAPYGIIAVDLDGYITIANTEAITHLGLDMQVEELVEMEIMEVVEDIHELKVEVYKCLTKGRFDFTIPETYHKQKYLSFKGRKILGGMIITISDITTIKEMEYNALNAMLEGQELERKRLAREIHDGIGPILSSVKMNLANIEGEVTIQNHDIFKKTYEMIDEAANDLRSISHNLMPKVLSDFGLIEALETLCERIDSTNRLKMTFIHSGIKSRLNLVTELGLYRISQELINNTIKHAKAKKITLQLIAREELIQLLYEDDGKGFYPDMMKSGIGMMNIESRTKALAGELIVDSQPGKGMTATVEVPIKL